MVLPHSSVQHLMQSEVLLSGCRVLNEVCCKKGSNSLLPVFQSDVCMIKPQQDQCHCNSR